MRSNEAMGAKVHRAMERMARLTAPVHSTLARALTVPHHLPRHAAHLGQENPRRDERLRKGRVRTEQGRYGSGESTWLRNMEEILKAHGTSGAYSVPDIDRQDRVGKHGEVYRRPLE